jgi:virulence-associated protein VapD
MTLVSEHPTTAVDLGLGGSRKPQGNPMYAIAFDMDIDSLRSQYGDPYNNAYTEIPRVLQEQGFKWQPGSVYFGGDEINGVTCVLAAQDLARQLPWFAASIRAIRMLRIEELNDLMPAVQQAIDHK